MTENSAPSFAQDILPMFRGVDRQAMRFAFDLWDYHAVSAHAENILERIEDGTMPCDTEWSDEQIDLFRNWIDAKMPT